MGGPRIDPSWRMVESGSSDPGRWTSLSNGGCAMKQYNGIYVIGL